MKTTARLILAQPWLMLLMFLLVSAALGWQARHFRIDASADTLLTNDNEHYIRTQVMSERFSPEEFVLVAYAPHDGNIFSAQSLADLGSLSEALLSMERVESVRSLLNVPMLMLMQGDFLGAEPERMTLEHQDYSPELLREGLRGDPIYEELLVTHDQAATAIQVLFRPDPELAEIRSEIIALQQHQLDRELSDEEQSRIKALQARAEPLEEALTQQRNREIESIRGLIADYADRATLYLGGPHVLGYQLIEIIRTDLVLFGSLIAGMICLVLFVLFGGLRWVLITVISCAVSVLLTVGLFGLLGLKTTVISSNFIALQLILTLAIVIHLIVQYRELSQAHSDWTQQKLLEQTLLKKITPCFYAGLTTSVGFASLLFTGIQPVISFGWMMIIAMLISIVVSLLLFPALMALFPREAGKAPRALARATLSAFHALTRRFPGLTLLACGAAMVLGTLGLLRLDVENSFINYFSEDTEVYRELSFIDQSLGGSTPFDVVITFPREADTAEDLVVTAETVQTLQRVQHMLGQLEGMGKLLSIVNFTELAREINDDQPLTEYELTTLYRLIDDNLRDDLVGSYFNEEHQQLRISARVQDATDDLNRAALMAAVHDGLADIGIEEERYALTNLFVLYQDILQRLFSSQILALGLVYLALTLTFLVIFRSFTLALIGIAPNILSTVGVLGVMGWLAIPLDLMTITIASIAMGIAVDDTIHYIHRYKDELNEKSQDAIRQTHFSVGYAILFTSLIIMMGFSQLGFSDFVPSRQFGLLASLAMFMALVWNLLLLPVLLARFVTRNESS